MTEKKSSQDEVNTDGLNSDDWLMVDLENSTSNSRSRDDELAALSQQLTKEKDARREERFAWVCLLLSVFDYILLKDVSNVTLPLMLVVLQLLALLVFAKNSGIEYVAALISNLIGSVGKKIEK